VHLALLDQDESAQEDGNLGQTGRIDHFIPVDRSDSRPSGIGQIHEAHAELFTLNGTGELQFPDGCFEAFLQLRMEAFPQARIFECSTNPGPGPHHCYHGEHDTADGSHRFEY